MRNAVILALLSMAIVLAILFMPLGNNPPDKCMNTITKTHIPGCGEPIKWPDPLPPEQTKFAPFYSLMVRIQTPTGRILEALQDSFETLEACEEAGRTRFQVFDWFCKPGM